MPRCMALLFYGQFRESLGAKSCVGRGCRVVGDGRRNGCVCGDFSSPGDSWGQPCFSLFKFLSADARP